MRMDPHSPLRWALPCLLATFAVVLLVWPVVRVRRETGVWATTLHRETEPGQQLMALCFLAILLAVVGFVVAFAWQGPAAVAMWSGPPGLSVLGLGLSAIAVVLVATAQHQMGASFRIGIDDAQTDLVEDGLFAWVRNPIYSALAILLLGLFLAAPSGWTLGILGLASATIARHVRLEERHLLAQHGDAYFRYASRVGRFVPKLGRLRREA